VRAGPGVVEVGDLAVVGLMERLDRGPRRVEGIGVGCINGLRPGVRLALGVQLTEVVVKGAVLLHEDDNMLDLADPASAVVPGVPAALATLRRNRGLAQRNPVSGNVRNRVQTHR